MAYSIRQLFHISASLEKVFEAVSTIEGLCNWWTVDTKGDASDGGEIKFTFGEYGGPTMKVIEHDPNQKLTWECIDEDHPWYEHKFSFALDENEGKTRVRFTHEGWADNDDFYALCSFSWGRYLESLRQYCQTGKGEAFGGPNYRQ